MSLARAREARSSARVSSWLRIVLLTAVVVASAMGVAVWGARGLGAWLVVEDPLAPARAVAVLGGQIPFRPMEAASIYHQGWAAEIWITRMARDAEDAALSKLGIEAPPEEVYSRAVLERLGVPPAAVKVLNRPAGNTAEELKVIAQELALAGGKQVILVTSKAHTRRVRVTWRALVGDSPHAIVRYASSDPYDGHQWWQRTGDALVVSREVFGLLNVWTGFPVRPAHVGL